MSIEVDYWINDGYWRLLVIDEGSSWLMVANDDGSWCLTLLESLMVSSFHRWEACAAADRLLCGTNTTLPSIIQTVLGTSEVVSSYGYLNICPFCLWHFVTQMPAASFIFRVPHGGSWNSPRCDVAREIGGLDFALHLHPGERRAQQRLSCPFFPMRLDP